LKNTLVEELRKVEADAALTENPVYYTIKSEKPLTIIVGDEEITLSKEDLIDKIKTENYRLQEVINEEKTDPLEADVVDDKTNK
jgi:hypothetical protein